MFVPILLAGGVVLWLWSMRRPPQPPVPIATPMGGRAPDFGGPIQTKFVSRRILPNWDAPEPKSGRTAYELDGVIFFADFSPYLQYQNKGRITTPVPIRVTWLLPETLGQEGGSDVFYLEWLGTDPVRNRPIGVIQWNKDYRLGLSIGPGADAVGTGGDPAPGSFYPVRSMDQRYFNERLWIQATD